MTTKYHQCPQSSGYVPLFVWSEQTAADFIVTLMPFFVVRRVNQMDVYLPPQIFSYRKLLALRQVSNDSILFYADGSHLPHAFGHWCLILVAQGRRSGGLDSIKDLFLFHIVSRCLASCCWWSLRRFHISTSLASTSCPCSRS